MFIGYQEEKDGIYSGKHPIILRTIPLNISF